jgi:DNA-binding response OmpR family regulator
MEKTEATVKILILEDNLTDQLLLQAVLEEESGWQSNVADRLETALCMLREGPYDAVLADLGVPDSQGLETLRRLRQANPMLPVLVLTGHSDDALGIQAVQEGAREYLVKGETPGRVLLRTVRHCVERSRMEGRLHEIQRRQTLVVRPARLDHSLEPGRHQDSRLQ